jgi:cobalt/nickel transport system permease protein
VHVPDGFLSPVITLPALGVALPLWAVAVRRHVGRTALEALPVLGSLTALAFVVQSIMIPVPGGTSIHLTGVVLLALLDHPLVAFVCESLVLLVQAVLLGAGGITVLGVNALALGLLGPVVGWAAWRLGRRQAPRGAAFLAAWLSTQVSALAVAGVLALQHRLDPVLQPTPPVVLLGAVLLPSLLVTGVVEGLYTLFALSLLRRADLHALAR